MIVSESEKNQIRAELILNSGLYCARYFFKRRFDLKMFISEHHKVIQGALNSVINGDISRLIINVPPGYTKTELATINLIVHGLAVNPMAKFMHLSFGDSLALENSSVARETIESEEFQAMFPLKLKDDAKSKKKWWTEAGGGVYATSAGGQVTGFRAGHMNHSADNFTGALIIDDPVKPDDAEHDEIHKVNNRFNNTIASRLAVQSVPIIVIMQRIDNDDLSGYLLRGGSGEKWHHLSLPVIIDNSKPYPKEYTHGIPIKHDLPDGWLWEKKHNDSHKESLLAHKRTFYCQYMQDPLSVDVDGALWTQDVIDKHRVKTVFNSDSMERIVVAVDPSGDDGKEKKSSSKKPDEIGIITSGKRKEADGLYHYYVFADDSLNGSPKAWSDRTVEALTRCKGDAVVGEKNYGGAMVEHTLRTATGGRNIKYIGTTSSRGKMLRAEPIAALSERGLLHLVGNFTVLEHEMTNYNGKGKSPNRLDAMVFAVNELMEPTAIVTCRIV